MSSTRPITAADRDAIANLQYFARGVVEGINTGQHRSPHKGSSIEFKEHRQYVQGDEIRSIDWKLYGKTDRLFIRQYEDETNLRCMVLVDQSGSMGYRGKQAATTKLEYAVRLAACVSTLLITQQDSVGVATLDTQLRYILPARSNLGHLNAIYQTLVGAAPGGETALGDALQQAASKLKRRGLLVLISDCFDSVPSLMKALKFFRHRGHEVVVFQVWDNDELEFPFRSRVELKSLENASKYLVDPNTLRAAYLRKVAEFRGQLEAEMTKQRIELVACTTHDDCGQVLSNFIASRSGKPRRHAAFKVPS